MKKQMEAVLALLGLSAFAVVDGKYVMSAEEREKVASVMTEDFAAKLETHFLTLEVPGAGSQPPAGGDNEAVTALQAKLANAESETAKAKAEAARMQTALQTLANSAEDVPVGTVVTQQQIKMDPLCSTSLFGSDKPMMKIDASRPYNERAYQALMKANGKNIGAPAASSMDYKALNDDLGAYYLTQKQKGIQSFLRKLPSLETIFPLESGYQDQDVIVNMFLEEFSQADNSESEFDSVTKGGYKFEPEKIRMFDVMFAHKFKKLKQLEKSWIGYLNKEGSDSMKWSFIEYILVETGKQLHNERQRRAIAGVRQNSELNVPGLAMGAADGFMEFLRKQIGFFKLKPFPMGPLTPTNVYDYLNDMTALVPADIRESGLFRWYVPSKLVVAYHKSDRALNGLTTDYKPNEMVVHDYPNVKIIPLPHSDQFGRIFGTLEGNLSMFEDQPNEMSDFKLEQVDWTLKVWSQWKESNWAYFVGKKYNSAAEQTYNCQLIFCNDIHYMPGYYFPIAANATTPSVVQHNYIVTSENTQATAITDIIGAELGQLIYLQCGSSVNASTIAASGNFSLLTSAWTPTKNDIIVLRKRSDGKFIEVERITNVSRAIAIAADDATPSLAGGNVFVTHANTAATAITGFDDATYGVVYTIYGAASTNASTIANSGNFVLTAAMTLSEDKMIKLEKSKVDGKFYEIERV